ncbi:hypothetical protein JW935_00350 [candidate division KSB1 bacterium]|nr:hypothetical protein [candidate division KSB1 bacterium]
MLYFRHFCFLFVLLCLPGFSFASGHKNFELAVYARVYEVREMDDVERLQQRFDAMQRYLKIDKIYLETHRDMVVVEQSTLSKAKEFFHQRGIKTSGGITITVSERNRFETYCYSNPEHRQKLKETIEFTAKNFDELILDDFFFTNCKCEKCIAAKGQKSWTDFRLQQLTQAAKELVLEPAKRVNPKIKVIIKYPNWYEHFQGLGFNLETGPKLFDGLYTGTETRDPSSNQHLQPYLGYLIFRYFENLKPGGNCGGWVDTGGSWVLDRYAEQLWFTLFAKAGELTLFDFRQMQRPINERMRAEWQGQGTSFNFDKMIEPHREKDGQWPQDATFALAAGYALDYIDPLLGELGEPVAVKSYKPFHSTGEDFLQTFLGMVGIPMDIVPEFPENEKLVLLTESAAADPAIVAKMKKLLTAGGQIVITSGLLRAIQDKGLDDIVELRYTDRKAVVKQFRTGWGPLSESDTEMIIPQIVYLTNDSWEEVSALDETNGWPILHSAGYANGTLYILTIPENFTDLYHFPLPVLNRIRQTVTQALPVRIEAPGQTSLFLYDNNTLIVQSYFSEEIDLGIVCKTESGRLLDIQTEEFLDGKPVTDFRGQSSGERRFLTKIKPRSFRIFRIKD